MTEEIQIVCVENDSNAVPGAARLSDSSTASSDCDFQHQTSEREGPLNDSERIDECFCSRDDVKRVKFGRVEFKHHPIILGDHPDCSCGPPVSLGILVATFVAPEFLTERCCLVYY